MARLAARLVFRVFRSMASKGVWALRRFTPAGQLLIVAYLCTLIFVLDTRRNMNFQLFTLFISLLAVATAWGALTRGRFGVRRRLPRMASVGQAMPYELELTNLGPRPQRSLLVMDTLAFAAADIDEALAQAARFGDTDGLGWRALDRLSRLAQDRGGRSGQAHVDAAPPGGSTWLRMEATPTRRGVLRFGGVVVGMPDPLGLFRGLTTVEAPDEVLVLPRRYPVGKVELSGGRRYQPGGRTLARAQGESREFVSLRDYRHGDPPRHIHWRSFAKYGKPIVKEFQDEYFTRHALVLDTFVQAGGNSASAEAFEEAVSVAASLATAPRSQDTLLDLLFMGGQARIFTAGLGVGLEDAMLEALAAVNPCLDRPFDDLRRVVLEHGRLVSGCVCVLLAWDEARRNLVEGLRSRGVAVQALVVGDGKAAEAAGGDVHFLQAGDIAAGLARL